MKQSISLLIAIILLIGSANLAFHVQPVVTSGSIYVRADGSIDPPTAPIVSSDNSTYTFLGDVNDSIIVERDNIVIDGAGHILQGTELEMEWTF